MTFGSDDDHLALSDTFGSIDSNLEKVLDVESVRPLLAALPDRERIVLRLRFFDNMTQTQIAERVGCSQMHVSRLLTKALERLRSQVLEPALARAS